MKFLIIDQLPHIQEPNIVYLKNSNWDDWFEFETVYIVYYQNNCIGGIKIGRMGQTERRPSLPPSFDKLPDDYFSLGTSKDYYAALSNYDERIDILVSLNDIAYNLN